MKKSKFSEERRKAIIEEVSSGKKKLDDVCRDEQISPATFYNRGGVPLEEGAGGHAGRDEAGGQEAGAGEFEAEEDVHGAPDRPQHREGGTGIRKKDFSPARQEGMIDSLKKRVSVKRACDTLGFRRNTYYSRKAGNRPEERDKAIAVLLRSTTQMFVA
jgi:transposase-like protein